MTRILVVWICIGIVVAWYRFRQLRLTPGTILYFRQIIGFPVFILLWPITLYFAYKEKKSNQEIDRVVGRRSRGKS